MTTTTPKAFLRKTLVGMVFVTFYVLLSASISSYAPLYSFSLLHFLAVILYWPCFVFAFVAAITAVWHLIRNKNVGLSLMILLLSLPMLAYGLYAPRYPYLKGYRDNFRLGSEGIDEAAQVNGFLLDYYYHFPERFHYIGEDDQVEVSGFIDFLKSNQPLVARGADGERDPIQFRGNSILSPVGEPLIFLLDRHHDGYLHFQQQKRSVNDFSDPWKKNGYDGAEHFGYTSAVGVVVRDCPHYRNGAASKQPFIIVPLNDTDHEFFSRRP